MGDSIDKTTDCSELFNLHCRREFGEIKDTLNKVKTAICGDALNGRVGMDERIRHLEKKNQPASDDLSIASWLLSNWKTVAVIVVVGGSMWNSFKAGKPMTVDEIKQVISQVQQADAAEPKSQTKPNPINQ